MSEASAAPGKKAKKSRKKGLVIGAAAAALLLASSAGFYALTSSSTPMLSAADVVTVQTGDLSTKVPATGTIESARSVTLFTSLTGPVEELDVQVGDRVGQGQEVARIDVSALRGDLDQKLASEAQTLNGAMAQVESAQEQYNQLRATLDQGLNGELNAAQNAQRQAEEAYQKALHDFDFAQSRVEAGRNQQLVEQQAAVDNARNQVLGAGIAAARAANQTLATTLGGGSGLPTNISDTLANLESVNGMDQAVDNLAKQQAAYTDALAQVDKSLADSQREVANAFDAVQDAARATSAAELSVQQQLAQRAQAVDQAERAANLTRTVSGAGTDTLRMDINKSSVTSPLTGVVTEVIAEKGKPASGSLLTVADDKQLVIKTSLREMDAAKVKPGQKVTFTTPSTGAKEFTGTVTKVSTVADTAAKSQGEAAGGENKKAQFPVQISINGAVDDLRLGGAAKLRIITSEKPSVISVPKSAIVTDDGEPYVFVAVADGDTYRVERRPITTGESTEAATVVTQGLNAGDTVITDVEKGRNLEGMEVDVDTSADAPNAPAAS